MMGAYTSALGDEIIEARVEYNEALTIQGPLHPSTVKARAKLKMLDLDARNLFSLRHD